MASSKRNILYGLLARYDTPKALLSAVEKVQKAGYVDYDVYTPFPIHGLEKAMKLKKSKLGWIVLLHGIAGFCIALFLVTYTSVMDYPLNISGKPFFNLPAYIPIMFELTVLLSAFGATFGMFFLNKLPRWHHPLFSIKNFEAATDDGFFICIESVDIHFLNKEAKALLVGTKAQEIQEVYEKGE